MSEASDRQGYPPTIIVDVPLPSGLWVFGVLFAAGGLMTRCFARWLAWPAKWEFTGDRANTGWAYRESLYADLGLVALAFGLALIWLAITRRGFSRHAVPGTAPDYAAQ